MSVIKAFLPLVLAVTALLIPAPRAEAKDLTGRLGVGFINQFSNSTAFTIRDLPAISGKYAFSRDFAILGCAGINTKDPAGFTICAKGFKNVFFETNLNFYVAGGAALLKLDSKTGIEMQALFGTEVFIPGIDSLGLSFEAGVAASNVTGDFVLRTIGYTFLHAGVHFYF